MTRRYVSSRWIGAFSLSFVLFLAGCSDFAQSRLGHLPPRAVAESRPIPTPALAIANTPPETVTPVAYHPAHDEAPVMVAAPQPMPNPLRILHDRATQTHARMDSYIFRMRRREVVSGTKSPEELVLVKHRQKPYSVFLKWLGNEGKGRQVIYVAGKYDNKMQVLTAAGDIPFTPAGMRMAFAPEDRLVKSKSRYPITNTGFGSVIERFGELVSAVEKNDPSVGQVKYLGKVKRPEFEQPVEAMHHIIPEKRDPLLPKGGQRWLYFDGGSGLPILTITHDPTGEVEYYCFDHVQFPVRLDDDDFNPDRWGKR